MIEEASTQPAAGEPPGVLMGGPLPPQDLPTPIKTRVGAALLSGLTDSDSEALMQHFPDWVQTVSDDMGI